MELNASTYLKKISQSYPYRWFFGAILFLLIVGVILLLLAGKAGSFFLLNTWHTDLTNLFFRKFTFAGDKLFGWGLTVLAFILFKQKKAGYGLLYATFISSTGTQLIKKLVHSPRPKSFFEPGVYQHFIDGVTLIGNNSFPSGHASMAFALATVLVIILREKRIQLICFFVAAMVGYSRIYLGQHFLLDVMVGALVGIISGVVALRLAVITEAAISYVGRRIKSSNQTLGVPSASQSA